MAHRASSSERLARLLDLSDDELLQVLGADALEVLSGDADELPQLAILLALLNEAEERVGAPVLRRWLRTTGPAGDAPIERLLARDFAAFEERLGALAERGFVVRRGGS